MYVGVLGGSLEVYWGFIKWFMYIIVLMVFFIYLAFIYIMSIFSVLLRGWESNGFHSKLYQN